MGYTILPINILALRQHLKPALDGLAHGRVAARMEGGRMELVGSLEFGHHVHRPEGQDSDLDPLGGHGVRH